MLILFYIIVFSVASIPVSWSQESKAEQEFNFAQKLYEDKIFVLAAEQFNIFAEKYPNHEKADEALFLSGEAYFAAENYSHAFEKFKELEISYPQSQFVPKGRYRLAQCKKAQQNFEAAAELFKRVSIFHPESELAPKALLEAGKTYSKSGKDNAAIAILFELIRSYPDTPERLEAHLEIVNIYFRKNEFTKAINEMDGIFSALGPELNDPRINLVRGKIFENMGQFKEAESIYTKLVQDFPTRVEAQQAYYNLGILFQKRGLYEEALQYFDNSLSAASDSGLFPQVYLKKGDIHFSLNQIKEALENYQNAAKCSEGSLKYEAEFKSAKSLKILQQYDKAASKYSKLISITNQVKNQTASLIEKSYFELTDVWIHLKRFREALKLIEEYSEKYAESPYISQMVFKKGEIFEKYLGDYSKALRIYDEFSEHFPFSPWVEDVQLALARCYEGLENYQLAVKEYEKYLARYPAAESYDWALDRKNLIYQTINFDLEKAFTEILNLFENFTQGKIIDNWPFDLGKVYLKLKKFEDAIEQFRIVLKKQGDGVLRDELFYYLGLSYLKLADKARLQFPQENAAAYLDSAVISLNFVELNSSDSERTEEASYWLAKLELNKISAPETRQAKLLELYTVWQSRYPNGKYLDFILINFANELLQTSSDRDTVLLQEALAHYQNIMEKYPESKYFEEAQFREAITLKYLGSDSIALSRLTHFVKTQPNSRYVPEAILVKARWEKEKQNYSDALKDLEQIQSKYFYSPLAAQAQREMAEIYFQLRDFQAALANYKRINEVPGTNGILISFKEAQAYENLGNFTEAVKKYLTFIRDNPEHESVPEALLAVARIAQKQNNLTFAKEYYESLLQHYTQPQLQYETRIALGDILFQQEKYNEARAHYLKAPNLAEEAYKKKYPLRQAIRCLYKLGQITAADSELDIFKKRFKDSKMDEAQLLLDKGKAFITKKNFQLAEKTFKKLKGDFKNTDYGAQGELGLGEVYLITNHTEDALKILTNIPSKYPDSEVTPLTYYNLGDFYFNSQQVENAITAFKQILVHPKAGELYPKALRYLIKCYDHIRLWDQAIASTREYLEKFPRFEDSFNLKIRLGEFLMKLKEYDRAIRHFQQLQPYADNETEAEVQFYIAQSFKEMGSFQRAASEYLKVKYLTKPTKWPWHVTAQYEASECLIRLGEMVQAKKILQRIINEQGSESNFGRFALKKLLQLQQSDKSTAAKED
ncbi:MAG: tetratricopeptide repeat protein [bacterium]